jgi:HEAT repeat protein
MRAVLIVPALALFVPVLARAAGPTDPEKHAVLELITRGPRPEVDQAVSKIRNMGTPRDLMREVAKLLLQGPTRSRENAAYVFSLCAEPFFQEVLIKALQDESEVVRSHCAVGLGKVRSAMAVKPLVALLSDLSPVVRRDAARALGQIGDRSATQKVAALLQDANPETQVASILALGELHDKSAVKPLMPLLKGSSETVRLAVAKSLCMLGRPEGRKVVDGLLESKEPAERRDGVKLLEGVKEPWVRDVLLQAMKDKDLNVAIAAAQALSQQGDGRGVEWLVYASSRVDPEVALKIETIIEELHLSSSDRKKILAKAPSPDLALPAIEKGP